MGKGESLSELYAPVRWLICRHGLSARFRRLAMKANKSVQAATMHIIARESVKSLTGNMEDIGRFVLRIIKRVSVREQSMMPLPVN